MDVATTIVLIQTAVTLTEQLQKQLAERRRNREMTPEEEAQWDAYVAKRVNESHWQKPTVS